MELPVLFGISVNLSDRFDGTGAREKTLVKSIGEQTTTRNDCALPAS